MSYFVPEGYLPTSDAILSLAVDTWPERWADISDHERTVWKSLNKPGGVTIYRLEQGLKYSKRTDIIERYADFLQSSQILRQQLFAGAVASCYCDEKGRLITIQPRFWGGLDAEEAVLEGQLTDNPSYDPAGLYTRLILVSASLTHPIRSQDAGKGEVKQTSESTQEPATEQWASEASIRFAFQTRFEEWSPHKTHPSERDDIAALESQLGKRVNRDVFRAIRSKIAPVWKARGRPSKAKSAEK